MGTCNTRTEAGGSFCDAPVDEAQKFNEPDEPIAQPAVDIRTSDPAPITVNLYVPAVDVSAPLDDRDIELVQQTFARVALLGVENVGWVVFMNIFELAPAAKGLFPFDDHEDVAMSVKMKTHAGNVVRTVATAVSLLRDLDTLVPVLQELGLRHVGYSVIPAHYDIVGQALIMSLRAALGPKMTTAVTNAYLKVYTIVKTTMIGDNYNAPEEQHPPIVEEPEGPVGEAAEETAPKPPEEEASQEEAKKKKVAVDKKKAEELKLKKADLAKKKKTEDEAKKKAEAEAKKRAEDEAAKQAAKQAAAQAKKDRLEVFHAMDKKKQDQLIEKLIKAAKDGSAPSAKAALDKGCDPDSEDKDGQTALHHAADKGKIDVVRVLLEYGASTTAKVKLGEWGLCALHYAARHGHLDIATLVFDSKAMSNDNFLKKSPIDIAKENGHEDIVTALRRLHKKK